MSAKVLTKILFSRNLTQDKLNTADKLLGMYVRDFQKYYTRNIAYNVHNLLHIVECAREFGRVDGFSAYKFENAIRKLQFLVHSHTNVFSQIRNRLEERKNVGLVSESEKRTIYLMAKGKRNSFYRLEIKNDPGKMDYKYACVVGVAGNNCSVRFFNRTEEYFKSPMPSRGFGIVLVEDSDLGEVHDIETVELKTMCFRFPPNDNKNVLFSLVHAAD